MSSLFLVRENFSVLSEALASGKWVVACLCAGWCDVCKQYRAGFDALALQYPEHQFVWIDIEDQSDLIGDLDVENFPTILMQRGDTVAFYGTMMPEPRQVARLLEAQLERSDKELSLEADSNSQRQQWQTECNLRLRLDEFNS
jgi:thiol-disulfide isomerase/thioredoxin